MESPCLKPDFLDPHYREMKHSVKLPPERYLQESPSISAIAALDAACAIAKNAIICENPTISDLMDRIDDHEKIPSHFLTVHCITDIIDRLRLTIHGYYRQTEEHIKMKRSTNLPF